LPEVTFLNEKLNQIPTGIAQTSGIAINNTYFDLKANSNDNNEIKTLLKSELT